MKAQSKHVIVFARFCLVTALTAAEPPLPAANDNAPAPHHGGEHAPAWHAIHPKKRGKPRTAAGKR
jgi:hypothetical protein